ncbi:MAG: DUF2309 domain-containing protein [Nitrospiraceae bacterium]|nr:DUF2309 domain-containing protein [Nitrospiraceae bacterium]
MEQVRTSPHSDMQRMELRGIIRLSSEIIARYWPMRTFVHHNPLHSLEYLKFDEAVKRGRQLLGGNGYLPSDVYRGYVRSGRIRLPHLDVALKPLVRDLHLTLGSRRVVHVDVLRACLTHGLCTSREEPLDALSEQGSEPNLVETLADRLGSAVASPSVSEHIATAVRDDQASLGRQVTLSHWCDRILGTQIVDQINSELIKWCEAFLDEGHATWPMPGREQGFYGAWKSLAQYEWSPCGIPDSRRKISQLPDEPEDTVLDSLATLAIPAAFRQDYLSLQLAALPGWAGFIKWRGDQTDYEWQQAYPAGLVKFMAVRLWYVQELVQKACREKLGIEGNYHVVLAYMQSHSHAYYLRRERAAGRLPAIYAEEVDRLIRNGIDGWERLADRYQVEFGPRHDRAVQRAAARRLLALTQALEVAPSVLIETPPNDLKVLVEWMDAFPESDHGPVWLRAFEAGYQEQLLDSLVRATSTTQLADPKSVPSLRPQSQSVYCIDVRSEPFRRHLESAGANETYGFAGFFAVFIRHRAWGKEHDTEQFPVIMRTKNEVREIPRNYLDHAMSGHEARTKLVHAGHTLLHDLKENVVTPYVMVESLGWFYGLPIIGKTVLPALYRRWATWLWRRFVPSLGTCVTVDKLAPAEAEEMLTSEQGATIRTALQDRLGLHGSRVTPELVEALRRQALNGEGTVELSLSEAAQRVGLSTEKLTAFVEALRRHYRIDRRWASAQKERITRTGFTLEEQVLTVDTALRMMGLTRNFARLVLFCAHGSTSENNPFESALDCGACGGNEGKPNARVLAGMANKPRVRAWLAKKGIEIPADTHFLAGQVDTATDEVQLFDLEEVPETHAEDLARLLASLKEAGRRTSQERCARLPDVAATLTPDRAVARVYERSTDWSQVRPEWGLSGNAAFIIGRRELTKTLNLDGRVFLHSYDYRADPTERLLEVLMTAPQVVAQWINMEHYFSAADNEVYGGGSKVYHNVVGRIGIMSGPWSDLRLGLAWQTMMNGDVPYHEPMRLLTVIEAPRARIERLIARHEVLQHYYHHEWVHLIALDPVDGAWYRYLPSGTWSPVVPVQV